MTQNVDEIEDGPARTRLVDGLVTGASGGIGLEGTRLRQDVSAKLGGLPPTARTRSRSGT